MGCPWTEVIKGQDWYSNYEPCDVDPTKPGHYDAGRTIEWGVNTGVCGVPAYGIDATDYEIAQKVIIVSDNNRDDFRRNLTDGRWWTMDHRKNK